MKGEKFLKLLFITFLTSSIFLFSGCQLLGGEDELSMNLELGKSEITPGEPLRINWSLTNKGEKTYPKENYSLMLGYRKVGEAGRYTIIKEVQRTINPEDSVSGTVQWTNTFELSSKTEYYVLLQFGEVISVGRTSPVKSVEEPLEVKTIKGGKKKRERNISLEVIKNYSYHRVLEYSGKKRFDVGGLVKVKGERNVRGVSFEISFYNQTGKKVGSRITQLDLGRNAGRCVLEPGDIASFRAFTLDPKEKVSSFGIKVRNLIPTNEEPTNISDQMKILKITDRAERGDQELSDRVVEVEKELAEKRGYFGVSGRVKNIGNERLNEPDLLIRYYNSDNELITTDWGAVNTEVLKPGQNETFEAGAYLLDLSKVDHYRIEPLACAQEELA